MKSFFSCFFKFFHFRTRVFHFSANTTYLDGFSVCPCGEADNVGGTFAKGVWYMEISLVFVNKEFGKIRVAEHNGAAWFVGVTYAIAWRSAIAVMPSPLFKTMKRVSLLSTPWATIKKYPLFLNQVCIPLSFVRANRKQPMPSGDGLFIKCFPQSAKLAATARHKQKMKFYRGL